LWLCLSNVLFLHARPNAWHHAAMFGWHPLFIFLWAVVAAFTPLAVFAAITVTDGLSTLSL